MSKLDHSETLSRWQRPIRDDWYSENLREEQAETVSTSEDWLLECERLPDALVGEPMKISLRGNGVDVVRALLLEDVWLGTEH